MKGRSAVILIAVLVMLLVPASVIAEDRSDRVSAAESSIDAQNITLKAYPYGEIDYDNPWYNLKRVTVMLRNEDRGAVYRYGGDEVNLFIKSSGDSEIGWLDKNDNGDYESEEGIYPKDFAGPDGYYAKKIRLSKGSAVTFYIGSLKPGKPEIRIYTDDNGKPGDLIGTVYLDVAQGEGNVVLKAYDEKGREPLKGHAGTIKDPYNLNAGDRFVLEARATVGGLIGKEKPITFQVSPGTGIYEDIGVVETDEYGVASLDYEGEKAGLYSFRAVVDNWESKEIFLEYVANRAGYIEATVPDDRILARGQEYEFEFRVTDDYGNPIDSAGENIVEYSVTSAPDHSKYDGFSGYPAATDYSGKTSFKFQPDRKGSYVIKGQLVNKRDSYSFRVEAVEFGKAKSLQVSLKKGDLKIPSVQYTDTNSDDKPEIAGRIEVMRVDAVGAEVKLVGGAAYNLVFTPSNSEAVQIEADGDVVVLDKNFTGSISVDILDREYNITKTFNLMVAGPPAALKCESVINGRKADVTLQYVDANGKKTTSSAYEKYYLEMPAAGITAKNINPFDSTGKASFILYSEELKEYTFTVTTERTKLTKTFPVVFKAAPPPKQVIGARNLVMFIGVKSYTQDGVAKSSDVAPFIKEGRTFVAVRPVADALGATIDWNENTQTVTLTRLDRTVTIVIGSGLVNVTKEGVTTTVTADVPAFIQDGRTVLPFRAVGEAFGAAVNYDATTRAVSYTQ